MEEVPRIPKIPFTHFWPQNKEKVLWRIGPDMIKSYTSQKKTIAQVSDPTSFFLDALNALPPLSLVSVFDFGEDGFGFVTPRVEIDIDVDLFLVLHLFLVLTTLGQVTNSILFC